MCAGWNLNSGGWWLVVGFEPTNHQPPITGNMPTIRDIADSISAKVATANLSVEVPAVSSIVTQDSRRAMPGGVFVAITGARADGNQFVGEATKRGAKVIISEKPCPE